MKQFVGMLLLLIGVGVSILRGIDLAKFTDPSSGLVIEGSVWLRYSAVGVLLLLSFAASFMAQKRPVKFERSSIGFGFFALALSAVFTIETILRLATALQNQIPKISFMGISALLSAECLLGFLGLITAIWFALFGISLLSKPYKLPIGGVYLAIAGSFGFYMHLILRFSTNDSSYHHFATTMRIFTIAAALAFLTILIRGIFFSENKVGRKTFFFGLIAFYVCTCLELPEAIFAFDSGKTNFGSFMFSLCLAGVGLLGAICAQRCLYEEKND